MFSHSVQEHGAIGYMIHLDTGVLESELAESMRLHADADGELSLQRFEDSLDRMECNDNIRERLLSNGGPWGVAQNKSR